MAPNALAAPTITRAESISLLHLLHPVPCLPSSNPTDRVPIRRKVYILSLETERDLASTLAFLSSVKDDPNHIPALGIMQEPKSASLSVLLAVNKKSPDDGKQILQNMKHGFESIFNVLSRAVDGSDASNIETDIFTAIIDMCAARILGRLRLSKTWRSPKQPVKEALRDAAHLLVDAENASLFVQRSREAIRLIDGWTRHQTLARLGELVEGLHRLGQAGELRTLLGAISNINMQATSRESLLNIISKVSRYREAARFLCRTARKFPSIRQMRVVLVNLPPKAFNPTNADQRRTSLQSIFSRINLPHRKQLNNVCRLLGMAEVQVDDQLTQQTVKTLQEAKIHAEIQLLFWCELEAKQLPPRVVCSSKNACFLCNAFVLAYGKMHTPRSHGKLYPGWRLPSFPRLLSVERMFDQALDEHIRNSITTLISRQKKTRYPDPNESTVITLPVSASTLLGAMPPVTFIEEEFETQPSATNTVAESPSTSPQEAAEKQPITRPATTSDPNSVIAEDNVSQSNLSSSFAKPPSPCALSETQKLIRGQKVVKSLESSSISPYYVAGRLELQLEYSTVSGLATTNDYPEALAYDIEFLTLVEARRIRNCRDVSIIDAESINGEISVSPVDRLYLTVGGCLLRITLAPKTANVAH